MVKRETGGWGEIDSWERVTDRQVGGERERQAGEGRERRTGGGERETGRWRAGETGRGMERERQVGRGRERAGGGGRPAVCGVSAACRHILSRCYYSCRETVLSEITAEGRWQR